MNIANDLYQVEHEIVILKDKMLPLKERKRELELSLSELGLKIKNTLPRNEFEKAQKKRRSLKVEMFEFEKAINALRSEERKWQAIKSELMINAQQFPIETAERSGIKKELRTKIIGLRNKYSEILAPVAWFISRHYLHSIFNFMVSA